MRRTRQSSRRLSERHAAQTKNTPPPATSAIEATVSKTPTNAGSSPASPQQRTTTTLIVRPMTIARPGRCGTARASTVHRTRDIRCIVSWIVKLETQRSVQHHLSARRPGARPVDRRDHHADLSDLHLRPGSARPAQGLRVRPDAEPDARRARGQHRRHGGRQGGVRVRVGHGGDQRHRHDAQEPATTSSSPTTSTAARSGCSTRSCRATSCRSPTSTRPISTLVERAITPATQAALRRNAEQPDHADHRPPRRGRPRARAAALRLVVDNTFASPYIQRPIELGADLVTHSTTKYLNGHSDSVGGVVVATRDDDIEWLKFVQNAAGAILGPFDSWLVLRGTKTLPLRMAQHNANGLALAEFLAAHPKVQHVYYPGLPLAPAARAGAAADARVRRDARRSSSARSRRRGALLNGVRLMSLAESLGGVETLISHPATMTHASVPAEHRHALGITDGLVRISAGVEDIDDLTGRSRPGPRPGVTMAELIDLLLHVDQSSCSISSRTTATGSTASCSRSSSPRRASWSRRSCRAIRCCSRPGALAASGALDLRVMFVLLLAAAVAGDAVNYALGRAVGHARSSGRPTAIRAGAAGSTRRTSRRRRSSSSVTAARRSSSRASCRSSARSCRSSPARPR